MRDADATDDAAAGHEAAALAHFARDGLRPHRWASAPHERFAEHEHAYHKVLYCVRGGITFTMTRTGERVDLAPGDRLDIAGGARHSAVAGPDGVSCIEAAREED